MAISASDVLVKLSTTAGSAGNSNAQGNPNNSLGKYISTTQMSTGANGLFDDISGAENAASTVDYRCIFIHNNHATLTMKNVKIYLASEVSGGASDQIGLDPAGVTAVGSASAQAATIANELTAPSGVTFSAPTTDSGGLAPADIPAGSCVAVWVKRTAGNNAAIASDGFTLGIAFDTDA